MANICVGDSPVVLQCPRCLEEVKEININNEETLKMCINTQCIYPFARADTMVLQHEKNETESTVPPKCDSDLLAINKLLNQIMCDPNAPAAILPDLSNLISELVSDALS